MEKANMIEQVLITLLYKYNLHITNTWLALPTLLCIEVENTNFP